MHVAIQCTVVYESARCKRLIYACVLAILDFDCNCTVFSVCCLATVIHYSHDGSLNMSPQLTSCQRNRVTI